VKYVYLIGDGMADLPLDEFDGQTILEKAYTPFMDSFAIEGSGGLLKTVPDGIKPGSDVCIMSLMGYAPSKFYTGRSPIEAASVGVEIGKEQIVYRCNLVTIINNIMKDFSGGHVTDDEAKALLKTLHEKSIEKFGVDKFEFFKGVSYRNIMRCSDKFLSVNTIPPHDIIDQHVEQYLPTGNNSDEIRELTDFSAEVFKEHPVNIKRLEDGKDPVSHIWLWGSGRKPNYPSIKSKYGVNAVTIAAVDLVKGLAINAGMDIPFIEGATGYLDTDYEAKVNYIIDNWHRYDFFFLHVEAPDEAGHLGSIKEKIRAIERFDDLVVRKIYNLTKTRKDRVRVVITPDHATPVKKRTHTNDAVPFIAWGKGIVADSTMRYSEKEMFEKGSLKPSSPIDLIDDIVKKDNMK